MASSKKFKSKKFFKIVLLTVGILAILIIGNFIIIKKLDRDVLEIENFNAPKKGVNTAFLVPSKFIHGERFYIQIPLNNGDTLNAFGDTGGGLSMIQPPTVEKKSLQSRVNTGLLKGLMPMDYILVEDIVSDPNFPAPYPLRSFVIRHPFARVTNPYLIVPPMNDEIRYIMQSMPKMEAFLGQGFFMGRSWTIDYINQLIWTNTPLAESELEKPNVQKIGFKKNSKNQSIYGHPSMQIEVDGEMIDVLFDTGATIVLSENGKKEMNSDLQTIGASFIAASVFDEWRTQHPDWKYFPKADMAKDVIEVPTIKIGGIEIGPVLFSKRADENWSTGMIHSMDKVVKGAIGGSALKYLKVTVDYNSELIKFEQ